MPHAVSEQISTQRPNGMQEVDQKLSSEKNSDRQELMQLCMGLRLVRLPCTSSAQARL